MKKSIGSWFIFDFYKVTFKKNFNGSLNGLGTYDFNDGGTGDFEECKHYSEVSSKRYS